MAGAGKGSCTDHLNQKYGWPVVHFGNMVYEEVQRRGLDNVKDERLVREDMRKTEGPEVLAKHATKKALEYLDSGEGVVVLDGLYSWSEYKYLEKTFGDNLIVIAITAPKRLRRDRVLNRKDSHRKYTLSELITREVSEIENIEKGGPIAYADYTIVNDTSLETMLSKLDQILQELNLTHE